MLAALFGIAKDGRVTGSRRQRLLEFPAVDRDSQFRRDLVLRVYHVKSELALAIGRRGLEPKDDGERVRTSAGPTVARTRVYVWPIAQRVGPADDEEPVVLKLVVVAWRQSEFRVAIVRLADLPQQAGFGG